MFLASSKGISFQGRWHNRCVHVPNFEAVYAELLLSKFQVTLQRRAAGACRGDQIVKHVDRDGVGVRCLFEPRVKPASSCEEDTAFHMTFVIGSQRVIEGFIR